LLVICIALLSPIDALSQQLFFMHMIQHLLLIMVAPPLLLLANPLPFLLWGLPAGQRRSVGRGLSHVLHRESRFRTGLRSITAPGIMWLLWVIALLSWHDPNLYNAALRYEWVHDLEHLTFFLASMIFWWRIIGPGPRIHKPMGIVARIALVLAAVPPNMALGAVLAFAGVAFYSYYEAVPRLWGIDTVTDQRIGGIIMWIPGSMMFIITALILSFRMLQGDGKTAPGRSSAWDTEAAMIAPAVRK
jgi:cytochrome c oxidase assembly factor CtaG